MDHNINFTLWQAIITLHYRLSENCLHFTSICIAIEVILYSFLTHNNEKAVQMQAAVQKIWVSFSSRML